MIQMIAETVAISITATRTTDLIRMQIIPCLKVKVMILKDVMIAVLAFEFFFLTEGSLTCLTIYCLTRAQNMSIRKSIIKLCALCSRFVSNFVNSFLVMILMHNVLFQILNIIFVRYVL